MNEVGSGKIKLCLSPTILYSLKMNIGKYIRYFKIRLKIYLIFENKIRKIFLFHATVPYSA